MGISADGRISEKQATILDRSKEIGELLDDFQGRLDCRFNRGMKQDCGKDMSENPNVLDEILERLSGDKSQLQQIMSFISSDVLPKIN